MSAAPAASTRRPDGGASVGGDSTPGSDGGGERITRLFPKCRPRQRRAGCAAMQHHRERSSSAVDSRHNEINNINNLSSDDERTREGDANLLILNTKGSAYKLRDSRIIEIAGGRELYSASRSKIARKLRHGGAHKYAQRHKPRASAVTPATDPIEECLHNDNVIQRISNRDTKAIVSNMTSQSYVNGGSLKRPHNNGTATPESPSPVETRREASQKGSPIETRGASQKGSPIAVVADGQVVVLDDISQDWKGLRLNLDSSDVEDGAASGRSSPDSEAEGDVNQEVTKPTRVIGSLPIAEYEGSPRRYGVGTTRSPRPGFPQRVTEESWDGGGGTFDYLYEFSETRKVLEEFFRCPAGAHSQLPASEQINFQELEYSLVRQQQNCSPLPPATPPPSPPPPRAVVGHSPDASWRARRPPPPRRLDSPVPAHTPGFLGLMNDRYDRELNVVELSVGTDSAGSEAGVAVSPAPGAVPFAPGVVPPAAGVVPLAPGVVPPPPHFALSPETTDCDSNCGDLDSELSLIADSENVEVKGLSDNTRSGGASERVSMPVVEDGLSSGHASDNDNNNLQTLSTVQLSQTRGTALCMAPSEVEPDGDVPPDPHLLIHPELHPLDPLDGVTADSGVSPPPPAPAPHRVAHDPRDPRDPHDPTAVHRLPLWLPPGKRANSPASTESVERKPTSGDEDEADTDLETDRLLGQQRTDDQGFFDDKGWRKPKSRTVMPAGAIAGAPGSGVASSGASAAARSPPHQPADPELAAAHVNNKDKDGKKKGKNKEGAVHTPSVLIEGVLFRARYLGSTQLACEGQPTKATRMLQAEEAVSRIKVG